VNKLYNADCREIINDIPDKSIDLIITSPPYWLTRKYTESSNEIGREQHPLDYIKTLSDIFILYKTKLKPTGNLLINIGDVYFGTKGFCRSTGKYRRSWSDSYDHHSIPKEDGKYLQHKQLLLLPARLAVTLQDSGFILRNDIIWVKNKPFPVPAKDRKLPIYEHFYHFVISKKNYYNKELAKQLNHNKDVIVAPASSKYEKHKATYSEELIKPFIEIYCPENGIVCDMFAGSGTSLIVAKKLNRQYLGCEISGAFCNSMLEIL
jgi:DNA modification methylase